MNINKQQIKALTGVIANEVNKDFKDFKEKHYKQCKDKSKLTAKEIKELKTYFELRQKYDSIVRYNSNFKDAQETLVLHRADKLFEDLCKKAGKKEVGCSEQKDIENAVVLATISSSDLEELTANALELIKSKYKN